MKALKIIIPVIIIIAIASAIITNLDQEKPEDEIVGQWRESGPFSIEKYEYNLGEKIFFEVNDLPKDAKGEAIFFHSANIPNVEKISDGVSKDTNAKKKYIGIEFDGELKQSFNNYFEPRLSEFKGTCSRSDLVGEWKIVFHGTQYDDMDFKILNQTASWDERTFEPVC